MDPESITVSGIAPAVPRQILSKEDWEELRPLIHRLYIDENRKFKDIAAIIKEEHGFLLTCVMLSDTCAFSNEVEFSKRQFDGRVAKWNIKKNATQSQRRTIIQNIGGLTDRYSVELNGRKVSRSKLIRWEKELKRGSQESAGADMCKLTSA
jgi:hypothetical protein